MQKVVDRNSEAQDELKRFLQVASSLQKQGKRAYMPKCPVDTAWHELIKDTPAYKSFTREAVGADVLHVASQGTAVLEWVSVYEQRFGKLPAVWFVDENNALNEVARQQYLDTGVFKASWDCEPAELPPPPDGEAQVEKKAA